MFPTSDGEHAGPLTLFIRYGIGWIGVAVGIVLLIVNPNGFGVEGFSLGVGGGLSVLMLNWMFRVGVVGDREREQEEEARRFLEKHGHWPDEAPPRRSPPPSRPPGAGTPR